MKALAKGSLTGVRRCGVLVVSAFLCAASLGAQPWPPTPPDDLVLTIDETAGVDRTGEVVWSGVPLARSLNVFDIDDLAITDHQGTAVPAQFDVLARWHAALDDESASIQWLLVAFPATVDAYGSESYRLVADGSVANPPPAMQLQISHAGDRVSSTLR